MKFLFAVLLAAGINLSAQSLEQEIVTNVYVGTNFTKHISGVGVGLYRINETYHAGELVRNFEIAYNPSMGTVGEIVMKGVNSIATQFQGSAQDTSTKFYFSSVMTTTFATTNMDATPMVGTSGEPVTFTLNSDLLIPSEVVAQGLPVIYGSYQGYWLPDVRAVNFIPIEVDGVEGAKVETLNGVDDPTCHLITYAGDGFVFINTTYVSGDGPHFHIEFVSGTDKVVMDSKSGEIIKPIVPQVRLAGFVQGVPQIEVKGDGEVVVQCSSGLRHWVDLITVSAPGMYSDTNAPAGGIRFYRIKPVEAQ